MSLIDREAATKSSPAHLDFLPKSLDLPSQEKKSAGKAMSNGKSELWEQPRRKVVLNAHTCKIASEAVPMSQDDDTRDCINREGAYVSKCARYGFTSGIAPLATARAIARSALLRTDDTFEMMKHGRTTKRRHMTRPYNPNMNPNMVTQMPIKSMIVMAQICK